MDMTDSQRRILPTSTTLVHRVFTIGILAKGLNGVMEILAGGFLFLVPPATLSQVLLFLTRHELIEDPHDLLANYLVSVARQLSVNTQWFGAVYLLSHGVIKVGLVLALWQRHLAVNATAPFVLMRALLPGMLERGWGRVVNIASVAGLAGAPYIAAYTASKHALVGLTRSIAAETAGRGVTVNAVCPGYVATDLTERSAQRISRRTGQPLAHSLDALARLNASGVLIRPEQVAAAVLALVSPAADGRTGETLVIE